MFKFEANEAVIIEQQKALEAALSTDPKAENILRKIIRKYILEARANVASGIKFKNGDPRGAARAVRAAVYRKVLGGNLNIYNSRKAHGKSDYEQPRTLRPGQRGGNRRKRSANTQRMMDYAAQDRGMILRWNNSGTGQRDTRYGNRGAIPAQQFFRPLSDRAFGTMIDNLTRAIEKEMTELLPHEE